MKKREVNKLLGFFEQKDHRTLDFNEFRNPDEAKNSYNSLVFFRKKYSHQEIDFSPYFTERVMQKLVQLSEKHGIEEYLSMQFSRVMAFGFSAVILLFLSLYFLQGQDGIGTLLGTDTSNDINFISYLFYDF